MSSETKKWGFDVGELDRSVNPADDFFRFVNGAWLKGNPIPANETRWGSFHVLRKQSNEAIRSILEEIDGKTDAAPGSVEQKVRDFYQDAMNEAQLNAQGAQPLRYDLEQIAQALDVAAFTRLIARLHRSGVGAFWSAGIDQDLKASDRYAVYVGQGGLGLPDRDDYFDESSKAVRIREQYQEHIASMFKLLGRTDEDAAQIVRAVMEIETELARASMTRVQLRDPHAQYNKMSLSELDGKAPNIPWRAYFEEIGIARTEDVIVCQPLFVQAASELAVKTSVQDLRRYLEWCLLRVTTGFLSDELSNKNFEFYGTVLNGQPERKPRWERVAMVIDELLGEAIGQLYVERHFSPDAKRKINELVDHLFQAYRKRIQGLDWMGPKTKKKALAKLDRIGRKLGYPDKWRDYSSLTIKRDSFLANWRRGYEFEFNRMLAKLGKPVDRTEWPTTPPTVNAYYHPVMNEIAFPAGIMQPPFFDPDADGAVNYGAIGAVIGHELTHGFDDEGGKYDADGNLKEWWTKTDRKRFEAKAKELASQYSDYTAVDDVKVNGELTLGENIADLGGVLLAYDAFREHQKGKEEKIIDGLTPDERFFLGFAQSERGHARDEEIRQRARTDPHSPSVYRVNGVVVNMDVFHEVFKTKPGDALYKAPEDRIRIW